MKKSISSVIEDDSKKIFEAALPSQEWQVYDIFPDYGKDYKVELVSDGEHTGQGFWVQLKGQKKLSRLRDGSVSFKLETKYLEYYEKLSLPLFLVVVDVTTRVGYWVFVQKYLRAELLNVNWRSQSCVQIRVSVDDILSNLDRLRTAVSLSIKYMTNLSFRSELFSEARELESLDPRFRVDISTTMAGRHYRFHADQPIAIEIVGRRGLQSAGKIEEMIDRGVPVIFHRNEIDISGSPLIEAVLNLVDDQEILLECNRSMDGYFNLSRSDSCGIIVGKIDAIPCRVIFGMKVCRVEARLPHDLFSLNLEIVGRESVSQPSLSPVDLSQWAGCKVLDLPYFEVMADVFGEFQPGDRIDFDVFIPGHRIVTGLFRISGSRPFPGVDSMLCLLRKARELAAYLNINPALPELFDGQKTQMEIVRIHSIILGEGFRYRSKSE